MDRKAIIILIVTVAAYFGYHFAVQRPKDQAHAKAIAEWDKAHGAEWRAQQAAKAKGAPVAPQTPVVTASGQPAAPVPALEAKPAEPAKTETVASIPGTVEYLFTNAGGGIASATLKEHFDDKALQTLVKLNEFGSIPIGALSEAAGNEALAKVPWAMQVDQAARTVTFTRTDDVRKIEMVKKFTLPREKTLKDEYIIGLDISYKNVGEALVLVPSSFLHLGSSSPLRYDELPTYQTFNWWQDGSNHSIDTSYFPYSKTLGIFGHEERTEYRQSSEQIRWAAVANQYFTTMAVILTEPGSTEQKLRDTLANTAWAKRTEIPNDVWRGANHALSGDHHLFRLDGAIAIPQFALEVGKSEVRRIQIFAGPRELRRLRLYENSESDVLDYGSFLGLPTGPFSKFLLVSMNWLNSIVHSYAWAIVLLTILVKSVLWPLQSKANKNMKKMSELNPEMKRIQDKYKDEPVKAQQEIGKLFKKAGVNPLSGCWPIFIQIPIFMGFYNMLGKAVELRHHGFLWVHDLSAPDTVAHVLGLPINPLPLLMAATMFISMNLTPSTGDPMQRRMFMLMPLMFIFMCYNFASALALYWTVQNIISIVQILINKRNNPPAGTAQLIPAK